MSDIILNDIKPVNLNINLHNFCKECNLFKPETETIDYTLNDYEIEAYTLTCKHMAICLKYNI